MSSYLCWSTWAIASERSCLHTKVSLFAYPILRRASERASECPMRPLAVSVNFLMVCAEQTLAHFHASTRNVSICIQFANIACATPVTLHSSRERDQFLRWGAESEMNYCSAPAAYKCSELRFNDFLIFFCWNCIRVEQPGFDLLWQLLSALLYKENGS